MQEKLAQVDEVREDVVLQEVKVILLQAGRKARDQVRKKYIYKETFSDNASV